MFETRLRAALVDWLRADAFLSSTLNSITEEAPSRIAVPWLGIVASASADWSVKDKKGREIRIAIELHMRGDAPDTGASLVPQIESRVESLPAVQDGFRIVNTTFLRARAEQRALNQRAVLLEYRFRLLED
ncbi:hypothetical protein GCM10009127_07440 [Alteraurantiacibacter aestuarii]|uniref:DUF3168 domain-containing protein n=1 Tax=Alteraurantiacibacter aestuarii TaxID=650004 RepID=A0A844ZJQ8_9SPHN|nr:DUF3168 domain-containing protein [Alteraurantiacibacter aestuarii]MXO87137.1 DUF3168 domain-containing protein [Alteraurantiacibacter aestuarii]